MNIFRPQKPYVFHPPKYTSWLAPLLKGIAFGAIMRGKLNVRNVTVSSLDAVADLWQGGHAILIAPNHADHADPHVLMYAAHRRGMPLHFMAAREGFERGRLQAFLLQRSGAFSVDREGVDVAAVKTAINIIRERKYPLVIFPEGEIYHHHQTLDALNEGVATIMLRASEKLPEKVSSFVIPTAIRFHYDEAVSATFSGRLARLEERIAWKPRPGMGVVDRIYRLGSGLLALKEEEFLGRANAGDLVARIEGLQTLLVESIESRHGGTQAGSRIPERIKALRGKIRKRLSDEETKLTEAESWQLYDDLDSLFVAAQLYSYPGRYLRQCPTTDRIAETILKLEEDLLGKGYYPTPRHASITFGTPIDTQAFLRDEKLDCKSGVGPLTHRIAADIQNLLDGQAAETES